ncbi:hypothetical protein [Hydrogenophaga sp. H7]|uniref:hypothetical protein n=1 Tax=Hydrogenophaga sp. H7 TaxID=1882399 RepID=UPI00117A1E71|nr:hypothetical protein [Hydrogenophaga sp. H7]
MAIKLLYSDEYCIEVPSSFPIREAAAFRVTARRLLTQPFAGKEWLEFGGASNLIAWRYRAMVEDWHWYRDSWLSVGAAASHEEQFRRDRALFGMFSSGVSCVESTVYALAALSSHPTVFGLSFGPEQQRCCSPKTLLNWLNGRLGAKALTQRLAVLCESVEWQRWVDLRNRMSHRSNLPMVTVGAMGRLPPPARALHFAPTSSTQKIEGDLDDFDALCAWLTGMLAELLIEGAKICPQD